MLVGRLADPRLSTSNKKNIKCFIEKLRGKTHEEVYAALFQGEHVNSPKESISKRLGRVKKLALAYGWDMPNLNNMH